MIHFVKADGGCEQITPMKSKERISLMNMMSRRTVAMPVFYPDLFIYPMCWNVDLLHHFSAKGVFRHKIMVFCHAAHRRLD